MRDREFLKQCVELAFAFLAIRFDDFKYRANVVLDGKAPEDRRFLGQVADPQPCATVHCCLRDVVSVELDPPRVDRDQAGDHVEDRCLSCAIGTEQTDSLATPHAK
jgi:hypothetical protein